MFHIGHIAILARNIYASTYRLGEETGLGNYDGGFRLDVPIINKIMPLGGMSYLEVIGIGDPYAVSELTAGGDTMHSALLWFYDRGRAGDRLLGHCLRCDSYDEVEAFAKYHRAPVTGGRTGGSRQSGRINMDRSAVIGASAPYATEAWAQGMPPLFWFAEPQNHPSVKPVIPGSGKVAPLGVAWIEVGGTQEDMDRWLGIYPAKDLPFRYNGKAPGAYAFGVKTDQGEIIIRRPHLNA